MGDVAPRRNSSGGGSWQPRGRGRGFFRGNGTAGGRFSDNQATLAALLPALDTQGSQQVITDMLEVNQGPYSGWKLYNKQESPHSNEQRKRRSPNWGEAETLVLLRLWAERVQEMKTTKRNGFMLEEMAQLLQTQGFTRSSTEVKTRIANLSQEYRMELRKRSLGFPHGSFKLWDAVHAILGSEEGGNFQPTASEQQELQQHQQQQQHYLTENWQQEQQEHQSGESAEALCCDIDPGMLMGQHDSGEEGEEDEGEETEPEDLPPLHNPLNGLPNVPPSLTISLTPAPSQTSNGNSCPPPALTRMPALIRVSTKRSSQDSNPPPMPPLVRKAVGKRPRLSLDSALLSQVKMDDTLPPLQPKAEINQVHNNNGDYEEFPESGWSLVAEQLRLANQIAENRNNNLTTLMEQQIKLQRQGLKMQKRILDMLEGMQPSNLQQENLEEVKTESS